MYLLPSIIVYRPDCKNHGQRSGYHGGPLKSPVHQTTIVLRCLKVALNWNPIMPRDAGQPLGQQI